MAVGNAGSMREARGGKAFGRHRWDRYFYLTFAVASCAAIFLSFGPTYFYRLFDTSSALPGIVHLHAAVFSAWMLLFLVQTVLIETGRVGLHRQLGTFSLLLAIAVVVVGYMTAVEGARTGYLGPGVPRDVRFSRMFMVIPLRDMAWFAGCLALALRFRQVPETHKRLIILLVFGGFMPVALARVPGPWSALIGFTFMLVPPIYDLLTRRRLHRVYAIGIPLLIGSSAIVQPLAESAAWDRISTWLIG